VIERSNPFGRMSMLPAGVRRVGRRRGEQLRLTPNIIADYVELHARAVEPQSG
jgi:hypothetical protein